MTAPILQKKEGIYILSLDFGLFLKFFKTYEPKNLKKKKSKRNFNLLLGLCCKG